MQKLTCLWVLFMGHLAERFNRSWHIVKSNLVLGIMKYHLFVLSSAHLNSWDRVILSGLKAHFMIGFLFCHIGLLALFFIYLFFYFFISHIRLTSTISLVVKEKATRFKQPHFLFLHFPPKLSNKKGNTPPSPPSPKKSMVP